LENVGAWLEDTKLGYFDVLKSALYWAPTV
jgi:hypothetical protein